MKKKIICYIDVLDPEVAENVASDIQADLEVSTGVTKSWVEVLDASDFEVSDVPWIESR